MSGSDSQILALGIDATGVKTGGDQARVTLDQLKQSAQGAAQALDSVAPSSQRTTRTLADLRAETQASAQATAELARLQNGLGTAFGYARAAAAAFGATFVAMGLINLVRDMTEAAARIETLNVVLGRVAQQTNYSAREISQFVQATQGMGITMQGARDGVLRLIQAHIDLSNATKLARLAQDAAVVGNINSTEAFGRLVYGIQSAQIEVLRTIGLNVNFERGYQQLAAQLGKNAQALTEQERIQARVNEAMQAGIAIQGAYEAAMNTAGKQLLSLERYFQNAGATIGQAFLPAFTEIISTITSQMQRVNAALTSETGQAWISSIGNGLAALTRQFEEFITAVTVGLTITLAVAAFKAVASIQAVAGALAAAGSAFSGTTLFVAALAAGLTYLLTSSTAAERATRSINEAYKVHEANAKSATDAVKNLSAAQREQARLDAETTIRQNQASLATQLRNYTTLSGQVTQPIMPLVGGQFSPNSAAGRLLVTNPTQEALRQVAMMQQAFGAGSQGTDELVAMSKGLDDIRATLGTNTANFDKSTASLREWITAMIKARTVIEDLQKALGIQGSAIDTKGMMPLNTMDLEANFNRELQHFGLSYQNGAIGPSSVQTARSMVGSYEAQIEELRGLQRGRFEWLTLNADQAGEPGFQQVVTDLKTINDLIDRYGRMAPEVFRIAGEQAMTSFDRARRSAEQSTALNMTLDPMARARLQAQFSAEAASKLPGFTDYTRQMFGLGAESNPTDAQLRSAQQAYAAQEYMPQAAGNAAQQAQAANEARIRASYAYQIAISENDGAEAVRKLREQMEIAVEASRGNANWAQIAAKAYEDQATALGKSMAALEKINRDARDQVSLGRAAMLGPAASGQEQLRQEVENMRRQYGVGGLGGLVTRATPSGPYGSLIAMSEQANGLPTGLLAAILQHESGMNPNAVNAASSASGIGQLLAGTATSPGYGMAGISLADRFNPQVAIPFVAQYLSARIKSAGSVNGGVLGYSGGNYGLAQLGFVGNTAGLGGIKDSEILAAAQNKLFGAAAAGMGAETFASGEAVRSAQLNLDLTMKTNTEREHALALAKIMTDQEKMLGVAYTAEQKDYVAAQVAARLANEGTLDSLRKQQELLSDLRDASISFADTLSSGLENVIVRGGDARQVMVSLLNSIEQSIWKIGVTRPLENALTGAMGGSGFFGLLSGLFGGGAAATGTTTGGVLSGAGMLFEAQGGIIPGITGYRNQIVDRPTLFAFAQGGVMGEAGSEAILPLVRDSSGNLGVRSQGGAGPQVVTNINITAQPNGQPVDPKAAQELQRQIDQTVQAAVRRVITSEQRPGGQLYAGL